MNAVGIEKAVLYPTLGLSHGLIQEADWACALARAYNTWLYETLHENRSPAEGRGAVANPGFSRSGQRAAPLRQRAGHGGGALARCHPSTGNPMVARSFIPSFVKPKSWVAHWRFMARPSPALDLKCSTATSRPMC